MAQGTQVRQTQNTGEVTVNDNLSFTFSFQSTFTLFYVTFPRHW